jgi:hypothetical protein
LCHTVAIQLSYDTRVETHFGRRARELSLSERQLEIVVGSLLGDAALPRTTSGFCFRVHHGVMQSDLVDWKYSELREFVRTPPRRSGRGYYFRTVTHPAFGDLASRFYNERRKVVPIDVIARHLTPLAMAVWIMDDGAADGRQLRLNTQCFSDAEVQSLTSLIANALGCTVTVNRDKGKPRLRFSASSMWMITSQVAPYILPSMRYKLPPV